TEGNITTDWEFDYDPDMNDYIGTVMISPYHKVTSGPVKVMLEAPTRFEGEPRYKDYFNELEFRPEDDGDGVLNSGLVSGAAGSIKILEGVIGTWDGSELSIDRVITGSDNFYYDEAAASLAEEGKLWVFKVEINTEANGLMIYHVNDGVYAIQIGHIVEDAELADNVKTAMTEMGRTAYAPWTLLASANRYAIAAGMRAAYKSLSGADLTPPVGKVSYTSADSKKGPVTASLRVADDSAGKITITNSGGSSHSFSANGQFVFEFVDEAGNKGRALAEVGTMATASSGIAVSYSTKHPTKDKVKVTMTPEAGITLKSGERATVLENGSYSFEASDNGSWKFIFVNEEGAESEITAAVVNIDRTPPTLKVEYIKDYYNKTVTAMVKSEEPIWAARGSTLIDTFKANGQQTLKAVDEAGNEASIEVPVNNIETLGIYKSNIDVKVNFSTTAMTNKPVRLTLTSDRAFTVLNNKGGKELEVIGSGKYQFIVKDSAGLVKIVEAQVNNIDTEAPVIKLGYPESTSIIAGEAIDVMNFTAVDNIDGDVKGKTKLEGTVNTKQPGTYQVSYTVVDSCGNKEVKLLTIKVLSPGEQIVTVNGIKYEDEPLLLAASKLQVTARGFSEPVKVKWTKGYESAAFFKASGTVAENGTAAISEKGWFTLYVYDSDRNFRLIHVYIDNLGGGQQ
ncbi:MAG: DUF5011 domain-containing protein, partial [Clostridiaceae bacterium]|nr:DUF5011 domain-containing protein [Clostridiaceae bacterium]